MNVLTQQEQSNSFGTNIGDTVNKLGFSKNVLGRKMIKNKL